MVGSIYRFGGIDLRRLRAQLVAQPRKLAWYGGGVNVSSWGVSMYQKGVSTYQLPYIGSHDVDWSCELGLVLEQAGLP